MATSTKSRFLVGIDLGTTNTVVAFCENSDPLKESPLQLFEIDQLVGQGEVARRPQLPSFRFHATAEQFSQDALQLPWTQTAIDGDIEHVIIGEWARELGSQVEGRQVCSAKSWLSHSNVDRESEILPWAGADDVEKVSPVIASASYLNHIRHAWNHRNPSHPLEEQEVVITVPASFDETARNLTLKAAKLANLGQVLLLEEPQAACYDWYARFEQQDNPDLSDIPLILICDVGGGTTDLSLIKANYTDGQLSLSRIGVGEHLMLGGDNIDLALAHISEQKLNSKTPMKAQALGKLISQTRAVKETLLGLDAPEEGKVTILGGGSRLIGGARSVAISKTEVQQLGLEGFFPSVELDQLPSQKRSAVVEFGLPYVADPAVTKHVAQFLTQHQSACEDALNTQNGNAIPVALLVNGGAFNSPLIKQRMQSVLEHWRGDAITLLDNPHPDYAVAYGAVAYSKARRGAQLKIGGGSPRSYFLHLPSKKSQALCLLGKGAEEGTEIRLTGRRFALTLDQPVRFNLLTTTVDSLSDSSIPNNGSLHAVDSDLMQALPPYVASLDSGHDDHLSENQKRRVEVQLSSKLTEVGTLQLECVDINNDENRWQVEFEVRNQKTVEEQEISVSLQHSKTLISTLYSGSKKQTDTKEIKLLPKQLERNLGKREQWDLSTSRHLFDAFALGKKRRRRSEPHEKNWLRLAGFSLRPGFGDPVDSWRMEQVWPLYQQGIQFKNQQGWSDWWIFWRRVSGGLNQQQQETILGDIAKYLHPGALKNPQSAKTAHEHGYEAMVRLSASLERLHFDDKTLLANWFISKATNNEQYRDAHWWALARLGNRRPLYGSQHNVIPVKDVQAWVVRLLELDWNKQSMAAFAAVMIGGKTGDRTLDISAELRAEIVAKVTKSKVPQTWLHLLETREDFNQEEAQKAFGDTLPAGLQLLRDE
ncbi:molecular chaperone DnaK [Vibrio sp. UCD-FRSSP16_10]|uniref:Hsp70 family protein n=1 Tax=unclassified Vibrio TaxID=2614977 RepID=UPI0007FF9A85|nr:MULTISPECIES: Hsp70 family protein [unclassified Vibrio]OBT13173.1 molecular chaperone DnaK [Vibrio sp. UCD-FRSSP16_30]OBT19574.1 molecular chaperone DnaK [Vibrio sp. UCD-FRSSP16_10]